MAFKLGNYAVKEVIYGVAQDFTDGTILYTLDQLTNAQIEVSSDPTEITDKRGNIIRQVYNNKTATFTATSALCSPALLHAQSGSPAQYASATNKIQMPKIMTVPAGGELDVSDEKSGEGDTIKVMGLYNNGANGKALAKGTSAVVDEYFDYDAGAKKIIVPGAAADAPTFYIVTYERDSETGIKIVNDADKFPETISLLLYCALVDPCDGQYKAAYVRIGSFTPDPSVTISFDAENQEVDFNGSVNLSFCGTSKNLYEIYIPGEDAVISGGTN